MTIRGTNLCQADWIADEVKSLPSVENSNAKTQNSNQETQKSNGDLIYRADVIEAFPKITLADIGFATKAEYRAEAIENINALPSADVVSVYTYAEELSENDALRNKIEQLVDGTVPREEYDNLKEAFEMILIYERCGGSAEQTYCPMAEKTCSKPNDISWCATCYDITEEQRHMAKNALLRRMEVDERINRRAEEGKAK